jgi:hypothetical protein
MELFSDYKIFGTRLEEFKYVLLVVNLVMNMLKTVKQPKLTYRSSRLDYNKTINNKTGHMR